MAQIPKAKLTQPGWSAIFFLLHSPAFAAEKYVIARVSTQTDSESDSCKVAMLAASYVNPKLPTQMYDPNRDFTWLSCSAKIGKSNLTREQCMSVAGSFK